MMFSREAQRSALPLYHPIMQSTYTATVRREGKWWIGWIEEVPGVNAQEATREELIASLNVILAEALAFDAMPPERSAALRG